MSVIYGLLPAILLVGVIAVAVLIWAIKTGQYEDMDGAAARILIDDEADEKSEN